MSECKQQKVEQRAEPPEKRSDMLRVEAAAVASGFLLSGFMLDKLVTMPVILNTNTDGLQAVRQWASVFKYGHMIGPALCGTTTILRAYAALRSRTHRWDRSSKHSRRQLMAALLTVGMVPFTVLTMSTTNNALFALLETGFAEMGTVKELVGTWNRLQFIRCLFPLAGAIFGMSLIL